MKRIKEAKAPLDREFEAEERQTGSKGKEHKESGPKRGRKPKSPDEVTIDKKANITDSETRIMKDRKGFLQAYNCQAACTEDQIIVTTDVTQDEDDLHQLEPMLQMIQSTFSEFGVDGKIKALDADAAIFGMTLILKASRKRGLPRGRIPKNISTRHRIDRRLQPQRGYNIYKKKMHTIEPDFGQIKPCLNMDTFLRRGLEAVKSEWALACSISNLLKLFRHKAMA